MNKRKKPPNFLTPETKENLAIHHPLQKLISTWLARQTPPTCVTKYRLSIQLLLDITDKNYNIKNKNFKNWKHQQFLLSI